ncbi:MULTISPECIES: transglycosylase SLT domain-containing protein [unclassified Streptomyces]|uniref:transglycosylase SLT domain-containing protein n=1 Tax=unclassified Streptomyces TaxID=2593676 RepID=UPI00278C25FA|nr:MULTISPECIES: transglycosylase SLT domain-containing protein [unclassified Streptomyces]
MSKHANAGHSQLTRTHKFSLGGVAVLGAAALAVTLVPGHDTEATAKDATVAAAPVAFTTDAGAKQISDVHSSVADQTAAAQKDAKEEAAKKAAEAKKKAEEKKEAEAKAKAEAKEKAEAAAKAAAAKKAAAEKAAKAAAAKPTYANNLDGWIKESLAIMKEKGIPGSYDGLHRNIMRESGGDPNAQNNTDVNAQNGTPSKGLLQVIQPTFDTYHVDGTANSLTDPVANIVAAANYAADKYGSIDNVDSAY